MPSRIYHAHVHDLPFESALDGKMRRTAIVADDALVTFVWMEPGAGRDAASGHSHPYDQVVYVVSGTLELFLGSDGDSLLLGAGDVGYVPRDQVHSARVVGDELVHAVEVFAPIRTDYLHAARHQIEDAARGVHEDDQRRRPAGA